MAMTLQTLFRAPQCSLEFDANRRVVRLEARNPKGLSKEKLWECLHLLGELVKRATPREGTNGGIVVVFDTRKTKGLDLLKYLGVITKWIKKYEKYTERALHYTLLITKNKGMRDMFRTIIPMFPHTRPVKIDTQIPWETAAERAERQPVSGKSDAKQKKGKAR